MLARGLVDALVVHSWCLHLDHAGRGGDLPGLVIAVAHDQATAKFVPLVSELDYRGVDFSSSAAANILLAPSRTISSIREEPLAVVPSSFTTLSREVLSRPVLRTLVLLGDLSTNHSGRYVLPELIHRS